MCDEHSYNQRKALHSGHTQGFVVGMGIPVDWHVCFVCDAVSCAIIKADRP